MTADVGPSLVGRAREHAELEEWWARRRPRPLMVLSGEAGVGKTTLALSFAGERAAAGATVFVGRCDEMSGVPYQPFAEILNRLLSAPQSMSRLSQLPPLPVELVRLLPRLSHVPTAPAGLAGADEGSARGYLFQSVSAMLNVAATDGPVLVVLEDLHWADKPSLLLLKHVLRSLDERPLFLLGTYRDTDLARTHPLSAVLGDLRRDHLVIKATLRGLSASEVSRLIGLSTGIEPAPSFADAVCDQTLGNPFFVNGLIEHLGRTGLLETRNGRLSATVDLRQATVPESVAEVVGRRLSRLSEAANDVLRAASVIGEAFRLDVLEAVAELPAESVLELVESAIAGGLVVEDAAGTFRFSHTLVRRVLYEELSTVRRIRLHWRIGEALESWLDGGAPEGARLLEMAFHFLEGAGAGDVGRAVEYAIQAGQQATVLLAYEQAADLFERALHTIELDPSRPSERRLELLVALARAQASSGDARAKATLLEAASLAEAQGASDTLAHVALEFGRGSDIHEMTGGVDADLVGLLERALAVPDHQAGLRVQLLSRLASELYYAKDSEAERRALIDEALALAAQIDDPAMTAAVLVDEHEALWTPENLDRRLDIITRARILAADSNRTQLALTASGLRLYALLERGDLLGFDGELEYYERTAERIRQPLYLGYASLFRGTRALVVADHEAATRHANAAIEVSERLEAVGGEAGSAAQLLGLNAMGQLFTVQEQRGETEGLGDMAAQLLRDSPGLPALARGGLVYPLAKYGSAAAAQAALNQLVEEDLDEVPRDGTWLALLAFLSQSCAALGDARTARRLYPLLRAFAGRYVAVPPPSGFLGPVDLYLGELATTCGDREAAAGHFGRARQLATDIGAVYYQVRADDALRLAESTG